MSRKYSTISLQLAEMYESVNENHNQISRAQAGKLAVKIG